MQFVAKNSLNPALFKSVALSTSFKTRKVVFFSHVFKTNVCILQTLQARARSALDVAYFLSLGKNSSIFYKK